MVLLFLTKPLQYLPQCVLGTLVFMVAIRLIDLRGLLNMRRESPEEYALALTAARCGGGSGSGARHSAGDGDVPAAYSPP